MKNIERGDIYIISRHSDLTDTEINKALKENVYNNKESWQKFLKLFLITLGVGFTVTGIIFFFAYNWAYLHKFAKIGLTQSLIIITTALALFPKIKTGTRKIILTGAAVLVGVLFAVFGQIYQTGANAYDFFLAWTIFISLWVIISNFSPLWLLYIVLANTTFILYTQQVAKDWSEVFVFTLLFILNSLVLVSTILLSRNKNISTIPNWFIYIIALTTVTYATIGIVIGMFENYHFSFPVLIATVSLLFAGLFSYGLKTKSVFYLSIIPFSIIIILSSLILKKSDREVIFLFLSLFIIASVTLVIKNIVNLQKKWANEK